MPRQENRSLACIFPGGRPGRREVAEIVVRSKQEIGQRAKFDKKPEGVEK